MNLEESKHPKEYQDESDSESDSTDVGIADLLLEDIQNKTTKSMAAKMDNSKVGRALSLWHARRMEQHKHIKTVMTKQQRIQAIGKIDEFCNDRMTTYMSKHAEEIFEPKRILDDSDWLVTHREPDQRFDYYKEGKGNIKWLSDAGKNTIYLFISDNSFTNEQIQQYKLYANAFFMGVRSVEIIKAGAVIPGQSNRPNPRRVPKDFLESEIESRETWFGKQYRTCGDHGILCRLKNYRPIDSYAMLCLTMRDLYPGPKWSFCFGWASFTDGVGAFSFHRYDPAFDGIEDPDREKNLLMRGCHIMAHEIGHQFGLRHCVYYECLMNGINSASEQRDGGIRLLCPVCQRKLQQNLKFDATERFVRLAEVCETLGFQEEADVYRKLIQNAAESGIVTKPKANASAQPARAAPRAAPRAAVVTNQRAIPAKTVINKTNKIEVVISRAPPRISNPQRGNQPRAKSNDPLNRKATKPVARKMAPKVVSKLSGVQLIKEQVDAYNAI